MTEQNDVVCNCAAVPPTMPTYPVWALENRANAIGEVKESVTLRTSNPNPDPRPSDDRNGCFLDRMWCCKVCDGEIPDGHTENCDIWKLEKKHREFIAKEYNAVLTERDRLRAALEPFAKLHEARTTIYQKRGGNPDSFPDSHPAYDITASQLRLGIWRRAAEAYLGGSSDETCELRMADGTPLYDYLRNAVPESTPMDDWTRGFEECKRRLFDIVGPQLRPPLKASAD